jgi:hypothetical protein
MATATAPAKAANAKAPVVANRPFVVGSRFADDFNYDQTKALTGTTQKLQTMELDTDGYTAGLYILSETVGVNGAAVVAFTEDGPFNIYDTIALKDTNNKSIVGPMGGHDLYLCVKYGGYSNQNDAKNSPIYSLTTGAVGGGGSATFILYVPIEIVHRDALGALTNKSSSSVFKLELTLAANSTVYSVLPNTSATVRTRVAQFGWMDSDTKDIKGNPTSPEPPAVNTVQYWDKQTFSFGSGSMAQRLNSFSGGLRTIIFEMRSSAGLRRAFPGDWPDPFVLTVDKTTLVNRIANVWRELTCRDYDYTTAEVLAGTSGTAATEGRHLDDGVWPMTFAKDFGLQPGGENRFGYLWLTSATALTLKGTVGATGGQHTFNVYLNYVNPANGDPKTLTGGR